MDVVMTGPLRAGSLLWLQRQGAWILTVVAKLTFELLPGESTLAEAQEDINGADLHWDDDARRSLYAVSDLAPLKPRADVLLVGHAFAPAGEPARSLLARMVVGEVDKSLQVHLDRYLAHDGSVREGARFARMSLQYERAAGGLETSNPVGRSRSARPDGNGLVALPNLTPQGAGEHVVPIGFGPLSPAWPARREKLGRHATTFSVEALGAQPMPADVDPGFFNAAPPDQQVAEIRDNERIVLEGLHREHPRLVTSLPGLRPRAYVERPGAAAQHLLMTADTLWIDTDRGVCTVTWRGQVRLDGRDEAGRVVVALEGQRGAPDDARRDGVPAPAAEPDTIDLVVTLPPEITPARPKKPRTLMGVSLAAAPVLPFMAAPGAPQPVAFSQPTMDDAAGLRAAGGGPSWLAPAAPPPPAVVPPSPVSQPAPVAFSSPLSFPSSAKAPEEPAALPTHTAKAAVAGVAAASDAAAGSARPAPASSTIPSAPPRVQAAPLPRAEPIELLWFDRAVASRVRGAKALRVGVDEGATPGAWLTGAEPPRDSAEARDQRSVVRALSRAAPLDGDGLDRALADALGEDGLFASPLVLVAGDLVCPFDELEQLGATASVAAPLVGNDKRLREAVDAAASAAKSAWSPPGDVIEALLIGVRTAFAQGSRTVAPGYLKACTDRLLLQRRCYQKQTILGAVRIRAMIEVPGAKSPLPAYLPVSLADELPLYQRFPVRVLAELRHRQDELEAHPAALLVLAVARALPRRGP